MANEVADVNADLHASADYRKAMIPVFIKRAVEKRSRALGLAGYGLTAGLRATGLRAG